MALFNCKQCGGDIRPNEDGYTGKCEYCGAIQTLPKDKDERISQILNRANDFRMSSDFDRAIFEYEKALEIDEKEPEAHWGLFLSKYGVEYVKDTETFVYKPTLHRISSVSVFDDIDYQATIKYASLVATEQYKKDATAIESVMKEFLVLSTSQEPYDIFISYKELDDVTRQRTEDSYLAHDLYNELTAQGYKVFFAPKSLIGEKSKYEAKIYSAIISSKAMIVLGTKPQYLEGVWVKNEWSRFAELIEHGEDKIIIPVFKHMEAGQFPTRIAKYNAYDMSSMTFLPTLFEILSKSVKKQSKIEFNKDTSAEAAFIERGFIALEDREFSKADSFFENALNLNPHSSQAYFGKLMVEMGVSKQEQIVTATQPLKSYKNFEKALRFADQQQKTVLLQYEGKVQYTLDEQVYNKALAIINSEKPSEEDYIEAAESFKTIADFKDAKEKEKFCYETIDVFEKDRILQEGIIKENSSVGEEIKKCREAIELYSKIPGWKDADERLANCERKIEEIKAKAEADRLERERQAKIARKEAEKRKVIVVITTTVICIIITFIIVLNTLIIPNRKYNDAVALMDAGRYSEAISAFEELDGYKDSATRVDNCYIEIDNRYIEIYGEELYNKVKNTEIGDIYKFGAYEQDNKTSNGKEEIEWIVVDKKGASLCLVSKYGLDSQQYNTANTDVAWDTCTLRIWLNETFINNAFSSDEQALIATTTVPADVNPGNATQDKIFLLSITEVNKYFTSNEARKCVPTDYAILQGSGTGTQCTEDGKATCSWLLRSSGSAQHDAAYVLSDGSVVEYGNPVTHVHYGVRPALWLTLDS